MRKTVDKVLLAGIGALAIARDNVRKVRQDATRTFEECVQRGRTQRKTACKKPLVEDLVDAAAQARHDVKELLERQASRAARRASTMASKMTGAVAGKLKLATRQDVERLEARINRMTRATPAKGRGRRTSAET